MLPVDHIRFQVNRARQASDPDVRDASLAGQMTAALIEQRRMTGAVTESDLITRFGFTAEEVARLGRRAVDTATLAFVSKRMVDPVAA